MIGDSDSNRSEGQGGRREALSAKEVRSKGTTIGTRTGSEAAMRAMSVLGSAKSNRHRKTHRVEPDGTGRKFMHLTRGGFFGESQRGVSRGHSSEESRRKAEGAKGRRTTKEHRSDRLREGKREELRNGGGVATAAATPAGAPARRGWNARQQRSAQGESPIGRREQPDNAQ